MLGTTQLLLFGLALVIVGSFVFNRHQRLRAEAMTASLKKLNRELTLKISENEDITHRLLSSEARLRRGIDDLGASLWELDLVESRLFVSDLVLKATGFTLDDINEDPQFLLELIHPDDRPGVKQSLSDLSSQVQAEVIFEIRILFKDDDYHWVHSRVTANHDESGTALRLVGSFADITIRVSAEEERDRLFNLSIDMLAVWGYDGVLQQVNPAWVRVLGWSRDELMGQPLTFFIHPDDLEITQDAFDSLFQGQPIDELDMRFRCRNGSFLWLSWSSFPYPDREVVFSVVKDITHNKIAERKLLDYQDRLRSLSSQLSLVEDRQRKELASAIHDGLAQQLFGIRAKVTLLKFPDKIEVPQVVGETLQIIDETMTQARNLSFELFPPVLHEVGLEAALGWLAHQYGATTGISCRLGIEGQGLELPEDIRTMAFQSVRELLANIRKHSGADHCSITISHVDGFLTLMVEDAGNGFDPNSMRHITDPQTVSGGFGLFSIRERMRSVHGRMLIDSKPDKGCRVFLTFPNGELASPSDPLASKES